MKESYLHWLWANKLFPSKFFSTYQGQEIEILDFGQFNPVYQGPDFQNASLRMDDCVFHGHIEMHLKSSDWLLHGHEGDFNYENVILHAVWEHDLEEVHPIAQIPTLVLSEYASLSISPQKFQTPYSLSCVGLNQWQNYPWSEEYQRKLIMEGYLRKAKFYKWHQRKDEIQVLYEMLGAALGSKVNQHAFVRLCSETPLAFLFGLPTDQVQFIYLTKSGLLDGNKRSYFQFKGLMPNGHPRKRIQQLTLLVSQLSFSRLIEGGLNKAFQSIKKMDFLSKDLKMRLMFDALIPFFLMRRPMSHYPTAREKKEFWSHFDLTQTSQSRFVKALKKQGIPIHTTGDLYFWKEKYLKDCQKLKCLKCPVHQITRQVNEEVDFYY